MSELGDPTSEFFKDVRQGHVLELNSGSDHRNVSKFVVLSQTCDVVLSKRPSVTLARVIELTGGDRAQAATRTNPRYVPLLHLGVEYFADLCHIESRNKTDLIGVPYSEGIDLGDAEVRRDFSLAITRWFGRFPFPDEVVPWLRPLEQVVREKYQKQSALGALLRQVVVEVRVEESDQWRQAPYSIEVHTIVRAEALPTLPDGIPDASKFLEELREPDGRVKAPVALAELFERNEDPYKRLHVLHALAESLASICRSGNLPGQPEVVANAVVAMEGHLWGDDEFPLSRVRKSEPLDLEYLSEPAHRR